VKLSPESERELLEFARSKSFRKDMEILRSRWQNVFIKDGIADADAYIEFVTQFNEFINHEPKQFRKIIDRVMKL
jgi:hypothetical protein